MATTESHLSLYSLGIAAENLVIGSKTLHITPVERLTFVDGELKSNPTSDTVTGTDAVGGTVQTKATTNNAITATWFPFHSNRHTPPDIRRGERVLVWRFADMDTFLWTELGLDQNYRKLETATYVWNATQDESDDSTTIKNSYYVEVSTHKGTITLQTSRANGEKTAHTVQFNPKAGTFTFADDLGQALFMDSVNHLFHVVNADASQVTLSKQNITIQCQDTFTLTAAKNINLTTQSFKLTAQSADFTIAQGLTFKAQTVSGTVAQQVNLQAPLIKLGSVTLQGNTVTCGDITCTSVTSSGDVKAPNIN